MKNTAKTINIIALSLGTATSSLAMSPASSAAAIASRASIVGFGSAFGAGALSSFSACVLPLISCYVLMMSGLAFHEIELNGINGNRRAAFVSACFVLGFSVAFTSLGALAAGVESPLTPHLSTIQKVSSLLIVGYGILLTGLVPRHFIPNRDCGPAGAFTMGLAFAFGWVPCVGLVLAGILALAAGENVARGSALLFTYSLGLGLPLIVIGLAANLLLSIFVRCQRHLRAGKIASGALLICIASSQHCPQIVEESSKTAYAAKGGCTSPP